MLDGWGSRFVRRTRKPELTGRNQSPAGALGSKPRELVAPSGCCLESGIESRHSERIGSRKQGCNDQTVFSPAAFQPPYSQNHFAIRDAVSVFPWSTPW